MKLKLTKPLVVFDLETTGLKITEDRIIQISYIKVSPDGTEEHKNYFVKPEGKKIPKEVQELTHITEEMVKEAPTFKELAPRLAEDFKDCDFAGFNSNNFDIPMLAEEFLRAGVLDVDFSICKKIDACQIFRIMEKRNLAAAYKFYCGRKMEEDFQAHLANEDTEATYKVLMGQLDMYAPDKQEEEDRRLPNDMDALNELCDQHRVDLVGHIIWASEKGSDGKPLLNSDGTEKLVEIINFGKYKGKTVEDVLRYEPGYISWMLAGDFPLSTKQVLVRLRKKYTGK